MSEVNIILKFRNAVEVVISLKLGVNNFKIFYVSFMVTKREKCVVSTQKNVLKNSKHTDTKIHQTMKKAAGPSWGGSVD